MCRVKIKKTLDLSYNLDYLVILPQTDIEFLESFEYTFGNTIMFNNTVEDTEFLMKFLRKNMIRQIIFVDYYAEYDEIINTLVDEHHIKFIFTGSLGKLSDGLLLNEFNQICSKYDSGVIDEIGFLDFGLYQAVRIKRRNTKYVMLDISKREPNCGTDSIGLLNLSDSNYCSFYNELAALSFLPDYEAKMFKPANKVTDSFVKEYGIMAKIVNDKEELICQNACNLDVNFAGARATTFIESMDREIPCLIGNNDFLSSDYPVMNNYLVLSSDDDVNEIADKIKNAIRQKKIILEEYKRFRIEYSKKVDIYVEDFLEVVKAKVNGKTYEKLLTVVVPVYNTSKYLAKCLDSIIAAKIPKMEILVVDDGSTDGSDKIVNKYVNMYPKLIRSIKQRNCGLGSVRNVGLKNARGKYLASVDSDDTVENEFFRESKQFMEDDVDVIMCDWMSVSENEKFKTAAIDWVFEKRKEMEGLLYTTIMPSTCNKIIKKSLFLDNSIKYLEQKYEDLSANPLILLKAQTIKYINKPLYNYYLRNNSLMRSKTNPNQMVDVLKYLDAKMPSHNTTVNMKELKYYTYSWRIEEYIINPLYSMAEKNLDDAIKYIYKNVFSLLQEVFEDSYYKKMLRGLKSEELKSFIRARNNAFEAKQLGQFIKKTNNPKMLTASIVYYGD